MRRLAKMAIYVLLLLIAVTSYASIDVKQFDTVRKPATFHDSLSYTIGFMTGYRLWKDTMPIDRDIYLRGIVDGLDSIGRAKLRMLTQAEMDKNFFKKSPR